MKNHKLIKEKKKTLFFVVSIMLLLVLLWFLFIPARPPKNTPSEKEVEELTSNIQNGIYRLDNIPLEGVSEKDKVDFHYNLERIVRHLESPYQRRASYKNREDILRYINNRLEIKFCDITPRIFLTSEENPTKFQTYTDLPDMALYKATEEYFIIKAVGSKGPEGNVCIQEIYLYANN